MESTSVKLPFGRSWRTSGCTARWCWHLFVLGLLLFCRSLPTSWGQPPWLADSPSEQKDGTTGDRRGEDTSNSLPAWLVESDSAGVFTPTPPLQEELPSSLLEADPKEGQPGGEVRSPVWFMPWSWIPSDGWANSAELGINGTDGNSQSFSFQAGTRFKRKTDISLFDLRLNHNRTYANGQEKQNNALLYVDFERFFGQSRWTYFVKNGVEYDEFKAFDVRFNINTGAGYRVFKDDDRTLTTRLGAGASREFGGPSDDWVPEALFGADYEHQLTSRHKIITRLDYFPSVEDFNDFRLVADAAWEYLIDDDGNLSLKLGANDRYDSTPNGRKANDVNYSALLLIKF
ncbi:MAG: mucin-like protein [Pirellulaceae bacterium]|nr:MAG: mucin-like protein [Pirellulaceae bacterium]